MSCRRAEDISDPLAEVYEDDVDHDTDEKDGGEERDGSTLAVSSQDGRVNNVPDGNAFKRSAHIEIRIPALRHDAFLPEHIASPFLSRSGTPAIQAGPRISATSTCPFIPIS